MNSPNGSNGSNEFCRICQDLSCQSQLISPCHCSGSISWVHIRCLEYWLSQSRKEQCELCHFRYQCKIVYPSFFQYILKFHHTLIVECFLFCIFTPMELLIVYLTLDGAILQIRAGNVLESGILVAIFVFLAFAYLTWLFLSFRSTFRHFRDWQSLNQKVKLRLQVPANIFKPTTSGRAPSSVTSPLNAANTGINTSASISSSYGAVATGPNLTTETDISITYAASGVTETSQNNPQTDTLLHDQTFHSINDSSETSMHSAKETLIDFFRDSQQMNQQTTTDQTETQIDANI